MDYFALLNEPRRPWLEADTLKTKFHFLSAEVHPDRVHQSSARRQTVRQPALHRNSTPPTIACASRVVRHLLELELGAKPSDLTNVPRTTMDLFSALEKSFAKWMRCWQRKPRRLRRCCKCRFFERSQDWVEKLGDLRQRSPLGAMSLVEELKTMDASGNHDAQTNRLIAPIWRLLSFYDRWLAQTQERVVQLSL